MKALFTWDVPGPLRERLTLRMGSVGTLLFLDEPTDEELRDAAGDVDVIVGWKGDHALLDAAPRCRWLINPGAGVAHWLPILRARNTPPLLVNGHGNARLTAQGAVALLLALANRVVVHDRDMREGRWREHITSDAFASRRLFGRKLGLLGYGHVNRWVHRLLSGFDMETHALRASWEGRDVDGLTPHEDLSAFLDAVDTLVVAVPQTHRTTGLIDASALERLGRGALLVNVGRGPVVEEDALYEALETDFLGGAALDVWYDYEPTPDGAGRRYPYRRPFHELDNVVLSPHRAASPFDDLDRWDDVIENLRRAAAGEPPTHQVDLARGY